MCRECIRPDDFNKKIKLMRVKDHFICMFVARSPHLFRSLFLVSVESTGMYKPEEIVEESIKIFILKLKKLKEETEKSLK
jgi:hypothetical protein